MSTLDDFRRPVEHLTDRELVRQYEILMRVKAQRERRNATARRLIDSLDDPDPDEPTIDTADDRDSWSG